MSEKKKNIVLVGGCFDVLHPGHITFLEKSKELGDLLVVLLESDEKVRKLKGTDRPVHTQKDRAKVLTALRFVDKVICLPFMESEAEYAQVIARIKPNIIAVTKGYPNISYHKQAANLAGAKIKYVTRLIGNYSTSGIFNRD